MSRTLTEDTDTLHLVLTDARALPGGAHATALARALARGDRLAAAEATDAEATLLALAGLPPDAGSAALERLGLGLDASGVWSRGRLVHLMPTLDSLQLHPLPADAFDAEQRHTLLGSIARFLETGHEGISLEVVASTMDASLAGHWHLRWPPDTRAAVGAPDPLALHDVREHMHPARVGSTVARALNELQMFLHQHPLNQLREAEGALTANALWCWGFGALPEVGPLGWAHASGSSALLHGIARAGRVSFEPEPVLDRPGVVALDASAPLGQMLEVAQDALARGRIAALAVHAAPFGAWRLTPAARWRLWRRPEPLEQVFAARAPADGGAA